MRISDILLHFLERADWFDPGNTVDRITIGKPDQEVELCLVTWMPSLHPLRYATEKGYKLVVCHESTFWNHFDDIPEASPLTLEKSDYIEKQEITFLRNHDCWDRWPEIGISWARANFLGLNGAPAAIGGDGYQHRYDIGVTTLEDFSRRDEIVAAINSNAWDGRWYTRGFDDGRPIGSPTTITSLIIATKPSRWSSPGSLGRWPGSTMSSYRSCSG